MFNDFRNLAKPMLKSTRKIASGAAAGFRGRSKKQGNSALLRKNVWTGSLSPGPFKKKKAEHERGSSIARRPSGPCQKKTSKGPWTNTANTRRMLPKNAVIRQLSEGSRKRETKNRSASECTA